MINNQKGMSLAIVLIVSALVAANIYYFLNIDEKSKTENAKSSARVNEFSEKRRLVSYLSDYLTCTSNFGGAPLPANPTYTTENGSSVKLSSFSPPYKTSLTKPASGSTPAFTFLQNGLFYIGNTHRNLRFIIENAGPGLTPPYLPAALKYNLIVQYEIPKDTTSAAAKLLKKRLTEIRIPLYVEFNASNQITKCFARTEESKTVTASDVRTAIEASCKGSTAWFKDSTTPVDENTYKLCEHTVTNPSFSITDNQFFGGVKTGTTTPTNDIEFTQYSLADSCSNSPLQLLPISITNGKLDCRSPDTCPAGSAMIRNGSSYSCSQACLPTYLFSSININGSVNCYERYKACPAGQYTSSVAADGTVSCSDLFFKGVSCGANAFATYLDTSNTSDPLRCQAYSRYKQCGSPSRFTYVSALNGTPYVSCMTYNY